jgi:hypothetical protein
VSQKTWRYALRLQADFFSRPAKSPPPDTACRDGHALVVQLVSHDDCA